MRCNGLSHNIYHMILSPRLYLISLLVLLQFAAPLIHAHKNSGINASTSVHLPEFEQVNTSFKHAPEFVAPNNHNEAIIAVSTGIKSEQQHLLQAENTIFVLWLSLFLLAKVQCPLRYFPLQTEPIANTRFFNLASPRAPPFSRFVNR